MAMFKKFRFFRNDVISEPKKWYGFVFFFLKKRRKRIKNIVLLCLKKKKKKGWNQKERRVALF